MSRTRLTSNLDKVTYILRIFYWKMKAVFSLHFLLSALLAFAECQLNLRRFVPYGMSEGDGKLTGDDVHSPPIDVSFRFYNSQYNEIFVSKLIYIMSYDEMFIT